MIIRNCTPFGDRCDLGVLAQHTVASKERRANFKFALRAAAWAIEAAVRFWPPEHSAG